MLCIDLCREMNLVCVFLVLFSLYIPRRIQILSHFFSYPLSEVIGLKLIGCRLVERLDLLNVQKPFEISDGEDYDSDAAKSQTDMFNKWLQKRWNGSTKLSNKNVRHSWCIRSIFDPKFSDGLAARAAGHSLALHTSTYANAIEKRDMEEQAKLLRR